jgi:tetratricopeptide (TPR) repeat protein
MKRVGRKQVMGVFGCYLVIAFFLVGCTTTKNMLGHLKFWSPNNETGRTVQAQKGSVTKAQVQSTAKGNPESHFLLGQHLQQRGKHREAVEEFTKTIKIDPMHARAYNLMGISYDNMGDFDHATKCYEVALDLSPTGEHYNNLGYNLVLKGEYDEAVEVLKTAAALEPQNDKIRNNLALAHSNKGSHDFALGEIQKTGDPDGNRLALAEALLKTGKALGASELVAQAARLDPIFEQKLSEKDQFVIRMTRTLKEQEDTKIVTAQEVKRLVTTVNVTKRADKETIKIVRKASVGAKKLKAQAVKSETDSAAIYPPDFMFNKRQVNVITGATEERKPKINQEPTVQFIGELFPIRYASGRDTAEHTPRTLSF